MLLPTQMTGHYHFELAAGKRAPTLTSSRRVYVKKILTPRTKIYYSESNKHVTTG